MSPFSRISEQYGIDPISREQTNSKSFKHKIGYALSTVVILSQLLIACGSGSNEELSTCTSPLTEKTRISAGDATFSKITLKHDNQVNKFSMINKQGERETYEAVLNHDVWVIKITNWKEYFAGFIISLSGNNNEFTTKILKNNCTNTIDILKTNKDLADSSFVNVTP